MLKRKKQEKPPSAPGALGVGEGEKKKKGERRNKGREKEKKITTA